MQIIDIIIVINKNVMQRLEGIISFILYLYWSISSYMNRCPKIFKLLAGYKYVR